MFLVPVALAGGLVPFPMIQTSHCSVIASQNLCALGRDFRILKKMCPYHLWSSIRELSTFWNGSVVILWTFFGHQIGPFSGSFLSSGLIYIVPVMSRLI